MLRSSSRRYLKIEPPSSDCTNESCTLATAEPYPGGIENRWKSLCLVCHKTGSPRLHNVSLEARSCATCSRHGIDLTAPGYIYIVVHAELNVFKVGVGTSAARLAQHSSQNFLLYRLWDVDSADKALEAEQEVIHWLRDAGVPPASKPGDLKYRGWTETASSNVVPISVIEAAIDAHLNGQSIEPLPAYGPPLEYHPKPRRLRTMPSPGPQTTGRSKAAT